ncbi:hypothetical protein PTE30175_01533 [Pandoraea terrae]|uniref:Uncharacterized protein n=1 Tax=Pandoraea terrae TaxID=1537710 RepID=A0A5E4TS80_9BURK|nr:DUF995 domain-containing protein [Pandoraea terrae]VVD90627.1 hypothetical protein PTE30175_01533 [Pandoraea terrae]
MRLHFVQATTLGAGLLAAALAAQAEPMRLSDVRAANGQQLTVEELRQMMPGAKVMSISYNGSTRRWTNDTDGKLNASSDNKGNTGSGGRMNTVAQGVGTWSVNDNGSFCVNIEWRSLTENWCRFMFKVGDKYYGVTSVANNAAVAMEFSFSK